MSCCMGDKRTIERAITSKIISSITVEIQFRYWAWKPNMHPIVSSRLVVGSYIMNVRCRQLHFEPRLKVVWAVLNTSMQRLEKLWASNILTRPLVQVFGGVFVLLMTKRYIGILETCQSVHTLLLNSFIWYLTTSKAGSGVRVSVPWYPLGCPLPREGQLAGLLYGNCATRG